MNSSMVKPEKFDHFHLVYHFTVPCYNLVTMFHQFDEAPVKSTCQVETKLSSWNINHNNSRENLQDQSIMDKIWLVEPRH